MSAWTQFVSKIFHEGKAKHGKSYSLKQAMQEASKRKSEMGTAKSSHTKSKSRKGSKKGGKSRKSRKTRKH